MENPLILSLDVGTQSVRAMLFDKEGNLVAKSKVRFVPYFSLDIGYAEQEPELYWDSILEAIKKLKAENGKYFDQIIGVTLTTMRDVHVNLDKDNKPIRASILWMDRREATFEGLLPLKTKALFKLIGMWPAAEKNGKGIKSNWIIEHEPKLWENTEKYVFLSCFLTYRLTGVLADSVGACIGHIPFNYKEKKWFTEKHFQKPMFKMELDKLFPLVEPGQIIGEITKEVEKLTGLKAGLPLIAAGSDKGAETLGVGAVGSDIASISFGTTATVQLTTKKYVEPISFLPAYPALYPKSYNPEIQIFRGYWMLSWFIEQFGAAEALEAKEKGISTEQHLDRYLREIPAGSDGLLVAPFWCAGLKHPEDKGSIVGFTESHERGHIYKAIVEGINFALISGLRRLERKTGKVITKLAVSGGGAASDDVVKLTADMFGVPVYRVQTYEASGLGAAICAFVGLKEFESFDEAIKNMVHYNMPYMPDPEKAAIYKKIYHDCYLKIPVALRPLYKKELKNEKKGGK